MHGIEMHLTRMHKVIHKFRPSLVIVDPLSNLQVAGTLGDSASMLVRLFDYLRKERITGFFTSLIGGGSAIEATDEGVSSIVDTWLMVRDIEVGGERNRALYVLKSRGMAHSNQVREFHLTRKGISLVPAYVGPAGVLTGSARLAQEAREKAAELTARTDLAKKKYALEYRRQAVEAQIESLRAGFRAQTEELGREAVIEQQRQDELAADRTRMARSRRAADLLPLDQSP